MISRKTQNSGTVSKCYSAIDYINGNVHGARDEDDLEELASLGSSSRLKKNLKELIDLLLGVYLEGEGKMVAVISW